MDFENAVNSFYEGLYRFAYSLTGNSDDASELTQETFARFLTKHGQIRDREKVKSWLSTTLYRTFLGWKRRETRHPHVELTQVQDELPALTPETLDNLESEFVNQALLQVEERYRVPLALYYFEQLSYVEISEVLEIPIGTVMSRLSRGKELLRRSLTMKTVRGENQAEVFQRKHIRN
ncbi:MAG TPA: RNA polymerase sigma factor [Verrucomicrobiae bacterium]|nr:RNA polymerase sigma factor [Verrucomicrobiae bacterium]